MSRIKLLVRLFCQRPSFTKPIQTEVVIFDESLSDLITPLLAGHSYFVVKRRNLRLNIPIFIRSLRTGFSVSNYLIHLLRAMHPKLVLTLIDNDPAFYRIKQFVPNARHVAIQNGWRGITNDLFGKGFSLEDGLTCDEILVFGPAVAREYEKIVSARVLSIGSFKNNLVPIQHDPESKTIALISTLRSKVDLKDIVQVSDSGRSIQFAEIFERRLRLAEFCHEFCKREGFHLRILGKDAEIGREFAMYSERLGQPGDTWSFTPRSTLLANYPELDKARAVISSSSSLGYEALGRGCRAAFFMIDHEVLNDVGTNFGWPLQLPDRGDFWSHYLSREEVERVLTHVVKSTDPVWRASSEEIARELISFEEGNTTLQKIIDSI